MILINNIPNIEKIKYVNQYSTLSPDGNHINKVEKYIITTNNEMTYRLLENNKVIKEESYYLDDINVPFLANCIFESIKYYYEEPYTLIKRDEESYISITNDTHIKLIADGRLEFASKTIDDWFKELIINESIRK